MPVKTTSLRSREQEWNRWMSATALSRNRGRGSNESGPYVLVGIKRIDEMKYGPFRFSL